MKMSIIKIKIILHTRLQLSEGTKKLNETIAHERLQRISNCIVMHTHTHTNYIKSIYKQDPRNNYINCKCPFSTQEIKIGNIQKF